MKLEGNLNCPQCGGRVDGSIEAVSMDEDIRPRDGDAGICMNCGAFNLYVEYPDGTHALRVPSAAEMRSLLADKETVRVQQAVAAFIQARRT